MPSSPSVKVEEEMNEAWKDWKPRHNSKANVFGQKRAFVVQRTNMGSYGKLMQNVYKMALSSSMFTASSHCVQP